MNDPSLYTGEGFAHDSNWDFGSRLEPGQSRLIHDDTGWLRSPPTDRHRAILLTFGIMTRHYLDDLAGIVSLTVTRVWPDNPKTSAYRTPTVTHKVRYS